MMFRVAFHGGIGNFWKALMTIPEVIHLFNSAFNSKIDTAKLGSTRLELISLMSVRLWNFKDGGS